VIELTCWITANKALDRLPHVCHHGIAKFRTRVGQGFGK
jgi:hypothetical protein